MGASDEAEMLRLKGNEHFRAKRYHNAINSYTKSLQCRLTAAALSNRAQAYLCTKQNERALMDAKKAISLDPSSVKGRYRHAMALMNLELYEMALKDLEKILEIDPKNKQTLKLKESINNMKNAKEVRLACVEKCDTIRSEVPLKELIDVRVVGSIKKKKPLKVFEMESSQYALPAKIPPVPSTSYQFLFDYANLKASPEMFAEYFMSIDSADYAIILGEVIETDMVSLLVKGYHKVLTSENFTVICDSLIRLGTVPRFEIASMFLDASDKNALRELLQRGELADAQKELIEQLYGL